MNKNSIVEMLKSIIQETPSFARMVRYGGRTIIGKVKSFWQGQQDGLKERIDNDWGEAKKSFASCRRLTLIVIGVLLIVGVLSDDEEAASESRATSCSDAFGEVRLIRNPKFEYTINGFAPPKGSSGFDYRLGERVIGEKDVGGPYYFGESYEDHASRSKVWVMDGYVSAVMVHGESKKGEALPIADTVQYVNEKKADYERKFGFEFSEAKGSTDELPHWVADVDPELNNGIKLHVYAVKIKDDETLSIFCVGLVAHDYIASCLNKAEKDGLFIRNSPQDLSLPADRVGRNRGTKTSDRWIVRKLETPIRHFTEVVLSTDDEIVTEVQMRGYIDCANDSDGPVFGPKTLAAIKAEMEALEKMYEEKYGLEFKDKSSDPQWPRVVANVNPKLYPDATLEIGRAPWHSDDHCDGYHIAITLQAEKAVRAYQKMRVEAQARENVLDVDANGF